MVNAEVNTFLAFSPIAYIASVATGILTAEAAGFAWFLFAPISETTDSSILFMFFIAAALAFPVALIACFPASFVATRIIQYRKTRTRTAYGLAGASVGTTTVFCVLFLMGNPVGQMPNSAIALFMVLSAGIGSISGIVYRTVAVNMELRFPYWTQRADGVGL